MCFSPKRKHFGKFIAQNVTDEYHLSNKNMIHKQARALTVFLPLCLLCSTQKKKDILKNDGNQTPPPPIDFNPTFYVNFYLSYLVFHRRSQRR